MLVSLAGAHAASADVYWSNGDQTIGRASLDGTGVNQSFITTANEPSLVAVDAGHIYWASGNSTFVRANLDGTGVDDSSRFRAPSIRSGVDVLRSEWLVTAAWAAPNWTW